MSTNIKKLLSFLCESGYSTAEKKIEKLHNAENDIAKMKLIYQWVKQDAVSFKEFVEIFMTMREV